MTVLRVDIKKKLGNFQLHSSFETKEGILALLGGSGSGKSMTLKCVAGIETPDQGHICLNGRVLYDSKRAVNLPPQKRRVGYLFQHYALFPNMTALENIMAGAHAKPRAQRGKTAQDLIKRLELTGLEKKRPGQLSGGQQQRLALARILASEPEAILLDEPLSALDSYLKWQLEQELVRALENFRGSCVWVSHDRDEVYRSCENICIIEEGRTQGVREKHELFARPGTVGAARLSGCKNYAKARPGAQRGVVELPEWGLTLDAGRPVEGEVCRVGLRVHSLRVCGGQEVNRIPCRIERVVEDVFEDILLLRVKGSLWDCPELRIQTPKGQWRAGQSLEVCVRPEDILLLK